MFIAVSRKCTNRPNASRTTCACHSHIIDNMGADVEMDDSIVEALLGYSLTSPAPI